MDETSGTKFWSSSNDTSFYTTLTSSPKESFKKVKSERIEAITLLLRNICKPVLTLQEVKSQKKTIADVAAIFKLVSHLKVKIKYSVN